MKKALFISEKIDEVFAPEDREVIAGLVDVYAPRLSAAEALADPSVLHDMQVLFTTWEASVMDEAFMRSAPNLQAVFYAAGSIKQIVTDAFWKRDPVICSAWAANAIPVAEFTVAQILLALKQTRQAEAHYRETRGEVRPTQQLKGVYAGTVGIISLGMIGRMVVEHLKRFGVHILAYDPMIDPQQARLAGATLVPLDELFRACDVVSLHAPLLKETERMIRGKHFDLMPTHATFINTARGAVVHEQEMIRVLEQRPDLSAVLDVTSPEPPVKTSKLWQLLNVSLTPHFAGSLGHEKFGLGRSMLDELRRFLADEPLKWRITKDQARGMA